MLPHKVHRWFLFTAVGSILPFLILSLIHLTRKGPWDRGIAPLIERGELLLVVAVLMATAFGDILASDMHMKRTKMWVGAATGLIGLGCRLVRHRPGLRDVLRCRAVRHRPGRRLLSVDIWV